MVRCPILYILSSIDFNSSIMTCFQYSLFEFFASPIVFGICLSLINIVDWLLILYSFWSLTSSFFRCLFFSFFISCFQILRYSSHWLIAPESNIHDLKIHQAYLFSSLSFGTCVVFLTDNIISSEVFNVTSFHSYPSSFSASWILFKFSLNFRDVYFFDSLHSVAMWLNLW